VHSARDPILSYIEPIKIAVLLIVNTSDDFDKFQLSYCVPHTTVTFDQQLDRNHGDLIILSDVSMQHMLSFGGEDGAEGKSNDKWRRCSPLCFMHLIRLEHAVSSAISRLQAISRLGMFSLMSSPPLCFA
jgi:hypothetical protein